MNNPVPSISSLLRNDTLAVTFAFTPLVLLLLPLAVYGLPALLGGPTAPLHPLALPGLAILAIFSWSVLVWRVLSLRAIFADGDRVEGVITRIWFFRQRGQCELSYTRMGMPITAKSNLVRTERSRRLAVGQKVTLVVDPRDDQRVFICALYL